MKRQVVLLSLALASVPATGHAQRIQDAQAAMRRSDGDVTSLSTVIGQAPTPRSHKVAGRTIGGVVGMGFGILAGGFLGIGVEIAVMGSECHELCGLGGALLGATAGGWLGTALGVSLPRYGSACQQSERFKRALGGVALGILGGVAAGFVLQQVPEVAVPAATVAPALGAALVQGPC